MSITHCDDCRKRSCVCRLEFENWASWAWKYLRRLGGR